MARWKSSLSGTTAWMILTGFAPGPLWGQDSPNPTPFSVEYRDGLRFKSGDGAFEGLLGGYVAVHARAAFDLPDDPRVSPDSFLIRQARVRLQGTFHKEFEYAVMVDFPSGSSTTNGSLLDAYLGWKRDPSFAIRVGQFKAPFGQEFTTSGRFFDFAETSILDRIVPNRDTGLMIHGALLEKTLTYEAGVFNGQGRNLADANPEKEIVARLRAYPSPNLRLGIAGSAGVADGASINGLDLATADLGVTVLDATAGVLDDLRTRMGLEFAWVTGPWGLKAEFARRRDRVDIGAFDDEAVDTTAWYLTASWVITGEDKPMDRRPEVRNPWKAGSDGWGTIEAAVRAAALTRDDAVFDLGLANPATDARGTTVLTLGLNWFPVGNVRVSPNLVFERYESEVTLGTDRIRSASGLLVRFQLDF